MSFNYRAANRQLLAFLQTGRDITANQARTRFGIDNVSARITDLRKAGFPIYLNTKTTYNGNTIRTYRLGTPTRAQLAAGYVGLRDYVVANQLDANLNRI